ncbi:hypothetical protein [Planococcus faecalis]|nr:hypothetical protein [Planococcus faecalis]
MNNKPDYYLTMGSELGDPTLGKVLLPHVIELNRLLGMYCNKIYCSELEEIALTLRVGGEIWIIDFEGCKNMWLSKKKKYIALEIGMPPEKWRNKSSEELREFIMFYFSEALEMIVKRIRKEKWDIKEIELKHDFSIVRKMFLNKSIE